MPVLFSLRGWAETWLPEDPAMVERDTRRPRWLVGPAGVRGHLPAEPVVLEFWSLEQDDVTG